MKQLLTIISLCCFLATQINAQQDTTIYKIAEVQPRFPGCEGLDTTLAVINECSQASLLSFVNGNIVYPWGASQNGIEGMVVVSFVVEKDGFISNPKILRDIGGGCGEEAMRVLNGMNEALKDANLAWIPGTRGGEVVRTQYTLPVKFKLREPLDYSIVGLDTVYVITDDSLSFQGGNEALMTYLSENLQYPKSYKDSCFVGSMDVKVLVKPDGTVKVLDVSDYSKLGSDFQFEAIQVATSTVGKWTPATRKGRQVPSAYDFFVVFKPTEANCQSRVAEYDQANLLVEEGATLFNSGETEAGIQKFSEAIEMFPNNANFLYLRGQAYMNTDRNNEACADFTRVKAILPIGLVNQLLPILCKE
jgi:hypothetical protein